MPQNLTISWYKWINYINHSQYILNMFGKVEIMLHQIFLKSKHQIQSQTLGLTQIQGA